MPHEKNKQTQLISDSDSQKTKPAVSYLKHQAEKTDDLAGLHVQASENKVSHLELNTYLFGQLELLVIKKNHLPDRSFHKLVQSLVLPLVNFRITADVSPLHPNGLAMRITQRTSSSLESIVSPAQNHSVRRGLRENWAATSSTFFSQSEYRLNEQEDAVPNEFVVNSIDALRSVHIPELAYTSFLKTSDEPLINHFSECLLKAIKSRKIEDLQLSNIPQRTVKSDCLINVSEEQVKRISRIASHGHSAESIHVHTLFRGKHVDANGKITSIRPVCKVLGDREVYILMFIDFHHLSFAEWLNTRKANDYERLKDNDVCFFSDVLAKKFSFDQL